MLYRGQPINAWFHASSGGITASAAEGLMVQGRSHSVCGPKERFAGRTDPNLVQDFLQRSGVKSRRRGGVEVGYVTSIKIGRKARRAGRKPHHNEEVPAPSFRVALGATEMKSTLLDSVSMSGDSVVMKGRGYGHEGRDVPVGAWLMSQQGKSAERSSSTTTATSKSKSSGLIR